MISGRFSRSRDEMKELIERHGGRNLAAVSGSVDYLVAGADDDMPRPADGNAAGSAPEDGGGTAPDTSGESAPGSSPAAGPAPEDGKDATRPGTVPADSGETAATKDNAGKTPAATRQGELF